MTRTDYPKIDIYVDGRYAATTTWARTCRDAVARFEETHPQLNAEISRVRRVTARKQAR